MFEMRPFGSVQIPFEFTINKLCIIQLSWILNTLERHHVKQTFRTVSELWTNVCLYTGNMNGCLNRKRIS